MPALAEARRALTRAARQFVPAFADCALVHLVERTAITCVAAAHCTREGSRVVGALMRSYSITHDDCDSAVACVVRTRRPLLRTRIHPDVTAASKDPVTELHRQLAVRSALIVPISTATGVVGALSLCYSESRRRHAARDIAAATRLAARIAQLLPSKAAAARRSNGARTATTVRKRPATRH